MAITTINTADLALEYESLKDYIETSFNNEFCEAEWYCPMSYDGIRDFIAESDDPAIEKWIENMNDEFYEIIEIEGLIDTVGRDFHYGLELIPVYLFPDYVEERMPEWGYNIPHFVEVDWNATSDHFASDYSVVTYKGDEYYF